MESRFIMAILPQELSEVCENPSQIYNIPSETGAMLRDASLLVRKIAALDAVIGGASVRAAITSFPGVASAGAGFPR
jgi:hypothetical protein